MNKFSQSTVQVQAQLQTLSPIQVMVARLTELPVDALRERIDKEINDNNWLESSGAKTEAQPTSTPDDEDRRQQEQERYDDDDNLLPQTAKYGASNSEERERELGDQTESFFDYLTAQMGEYDLSDHQREILQYLIGSLDDDGLLRTPLYQIADELDIYQGITSTPEELEHALQTLQQMDPPGVGARNLRECLILQTKRYYNGEKRDLMLRIFLKHWDEFAHLHWERLRHLLKIDQLEMDNIKRSIRKLNPRPGGSVGNDSRHDNHTVLPDFFVDTDNDGRLHMRLNEGELPTLTISEDAKEALQIPAVSKSEREAQRYIRERVENAQMFIEAIAQRRRSMQAVMKAIILLQKRFFLDGDESALRPMKLEDVAAKSGLDISTVSRVSNSKYVQTNHGIYPLRYFFSAATTQDGQEVSVRLALDALRQLVEQEDKSKPLSDQQLTKLLQEKGFNVARRTIAKYRTQLGIPESRLRKG